MPFLILLNDMQGVELITDALRRTGGIAQCELAAGIEDNLMTVEEADITVAEAPPPFRPQIIKEVIVSMSEMLAMQTGDIRHIATIPAGAVIHSHGPTADGGYAILYTE